MLPRSTDETDKFMENAFRDGAIRTTGTDIDKILPAMSRFGGGNRQEKKKTVIFPSAICPIGKRRS